MAEKKFYIVWNAARNEGFITDDRLDAQDAHKRKKDFSGSTLGNAFVESYGHQKRHRQTITIEINE